MYSEHILYTIRHFRHIRLQLTQSNPVGLMKFNCCLRDDNGEIQRSEMICPSLYIYYMYDDIWKIKGIKFYYPEFFYLIFFKLFIW